MKGIEHKKNIILAREVEDKEGAKCGCLKGLSDETNGQKWNMLSQELVYNMNEWSVKCDKTEKCSLQVLRGDVYFF